MKENKYIALIYKSLKGEITSVEQQDLDQWMSNPVNGQLYDRIAEEWAAAEGYTPEIEVDVAADFAKLKGRMTAERPTKVVEMKPKRRPWLSIAAGIASLVAGGLWMMTQMQPEAPMLSAVTAANETKEIRLPDSTIVFLNENSSISFPAYFEDDLRMVTLSGEAFFDVKRDESAMFVARTRLADVEVLGTSFNIDSYDGDPRFEVTVSSGTVQLRPKNSSKFITMTKGQVGVFDAKTKQLYKNWENPNTHRWRTGEFSFDDQYLRDVLVEIEKEFAIVPILERKDLEGCKLTARFENATADKVMQYVARTFEMELKIENEVEYHLLGGESCNKTVNYRSQ